MPTRIIITIADRAEAEAFVNDTNKTQSFCYVDADGDENEQGVISIELEDVNGTGAS